MISPERLFEAWYEFRRGKVIAAMFNSLAEAIDELPFYD
jgi:hypothetical protein